MGNEYSKVVRLFLFVLTTCSIIHRTIMYISFVHIITLCTTSSGNLHVNVFLDLLRSFLFEYNITERKSFLKGFLILYKINSHPFLKLSLNKKVCPRTPKLHMKLVTTEKKWRKLISLETYPSTTV